MQSGDTPPTKLQTSPVNYPARACAKGLSNQFACTVRPVKNFKI